MKFSRDTNSKDLNQISSWLLEDATNILPNALDNIIQHQINNDLFVLRLDGDTIAFACVVFTAPYMEVKYAAVKKEFMSENYMKRMLDSLSTFYYKHGYVAQIVHSDVFDDTSLGGMGFIGFYGSNVGYFYRPTIPTLSPNGSGLISLEIWPPSFYHDYNNLPLFKWSFNLNHKGFITPAPIVFGCDYNYFFRLKWGEKIKTGEIKNFYKGSWFLEKILYLDQLDKSEIFTKFSS